MVTFVDVFFFFASSLDTVSLAPGFGFAWNKTADKRGTRIEISINIEAKEQERGASALKAAEKIPQNAST